MNQKVLRRSNCSWCGRSNLVRTCAGGCETGGMEIVSHICRYHHRFYLTPIAYWCLLLLPVLVSASCLGY